MVVVVDSVVVVMMVVSPAVEIVAKSPESVINIERSDSRASFTLGDKFEFSRIVFNSAILVSVSDLTLEADSLIRSSGVAAVVRVEPESCPCFPETVIVEVLCRVVQKTPILCTFAFTSPSILSLTASFSVFSSDR